MIATRQTSRVELDWMRPEDDTGVRQLLRELAMDGEIRLAMARDPSFLDALCVEGESHDVLVGREHSSGRVVGVGSRSTKCVYVNGAAQTIGYLGGLRAHPDYRGGRDFFRAYKRMHQAHLRQPASIQLTTIFEENVRATRLLTSGRMQLPSYHDLGRFYTLCYAPRVIRDTRSIRQATLSDRETLLRFLNEEGPHRQFYPAYLESDWGTPGGLLRDLSWGDMLCVEDDSGVIGCLGTWDQRAYRQTMVDSYGPRFRAARPLWNALAPLHRRPRLPGTGEVMNSRTIATVCVADDDGTVFERLLHAALSKAVEQGAQQIAIGFHERDPLLPVAQRIPHVAIHSRLYAVAWPEDEDPRGVLDDRVPYLELGGL